MKGEGEKRGMAVTGVTRREIACMKGNGETSVLKPACTLPEGMLREGFVGENSRRS